MIDLKDLLELKSEAEQRKANAEAEIRVVDRLIEFEQAKVCEAPKVDCSYEVGAIAEDVVDGSY